MQDDRPQINAATILCPAEKRTRSVSASGSHAALGLLVLHAESVLRTTRALLVPGQVQVIRFGAESAASSKSTIWNPSLKKRLITAGSEKPVRDMEFDFADRKSHAEELDEASLFGIGCRR